MANELTVREASEQRRSIRKYTTDPISDQELTDIIQTAGLAPSPWNFQPWRVIAVKDAEVKKKLQAAAYGQPQVGENAVLLVITSDMSDTLLNLEEVVHPGYGDQVPTLAAQWKGMFESKTLEERDRWGFSYSFIFVGFLLLAAQSKGWSSSTMAGFVPDQVKEVLGLSADVQVVTLIALGHAAEDGFPHHRHSTDRFLKFV